MPGRIDDLEASGAGGVATAEMAILLPFIVMLAFAMVEASRMCMVTQVLANAAREGCRVAVCNGKTSADVIARVDSTLTAARIDPTLVTVTLSPTAIQQATSSSQITLTLGVDFSKVNWFSSPFFFPSTTRLSASAVMLSQRQ